MRTCGNVLEEAARVAARIGFSESREIDFRSFLLITGSFGCEALLEVHEGCACGVAHISQFAAAEELSKVHAVHVQTIL